MAIQNNTYCPIKECGTKCDSDCEWNFKKKCAVYWIGKYVAEKLLKEI